MPQVLKQPSEFVLHGFDMVDAIGDNESIVSSNANGSLSVLVFDKDGTDVTLDLIEGLPTISNTTVSVMLKAGTNLSSYNIQWKIPTSYGQILEEDATLTVIEKKG